MKMGDRTVHARSPYSYAGVSIGSSRSAGRWRFGSFFGFRSTCLNPSHSIGAELTRLGNRPAAFHCVRHVGANTKPALSVGFDKALACRDAQRQYPGANSIQIIRFCRVWWSTGIMPTTPMQKRGKNRACDVGSVRSFSIGEISRFFASVSGKIRPARLQF